MFSSNWCEILLHHFILLVRSFFSRFVMFCFIPRFAWVCFGLVNILQRTQLMQSKSNMRWVLSSFFFLRLYEAEPSVRFNHMCCCFHSFGYYVYFWLPCNLFYLRFSVAQILITQAICFPFLFVEIYTSSASVVFFYLNVDILYLWSTWSVGYRIHYHNHHQCYYFSRKKKRQRQQRWSVMGIEHRFLVFDTGMKNNWIIL